VSRFSRRLLAAVSFLPMLALPVTMASPMTGGQVNHAPHAASSAGPGDGHTAGAEQRSGPSRKPRPRERIAVGDQWRVLVGRLPIQMPQPEWPTPEAWLFVATAMEKDGDGTHLIVTATREGEPRPTVRLFLDPETQAITRAEVVALASGGGRVFTERRTPGEPFVCESSPVPIAQAAAGPGQTGKAGKAEEEVVAKSPPMTDGPGPGGSGKPVENQQPATNNGELTGGFSFGGRLRERTVPVDAGVGRALIRRGLAPLNRPSGAASEPFGVPRVLTVIEGPGLRIEQVWDETTPWPLYSQTDTSRCWLVAYTKGKSP
jgi:hypothetical protein